MAELLNEKDLASVSGGDGASYTFSSGERKPVSLNTGYWVDSDGSGKMYTAYVGRSGLYAEYKMPGKACPYLITDENGEAVGWVPYCNITFLN